MRDCAPVIDAMQSITWFSHVGSEYGASGDMDVSLVPNWEKAVALRGKNSTSNAFLEGVNLLTSDLSERFRSEDRKWNEIAAHAGESLQAEILPRLGAVIDGHADIRSTAIDIDFLKESVQWDLIHIVMEYVYSDLVAPRFYMLVFDVYQVGHFPCSWNEMWPDGIIWVY